MERHFVLFLSASPGFSLALGHRLTLYEQLAPLCGVGAGRRGEFSRQCSGAQGGGGGGGWVSELELHVSLSLPFKLLRCHLLCNVFFFKKSKKQKPKKVKGDSNCKTKENTVVQVEEEFTR